MRFRFPLEGVLRIRRLLEEQARKRLDESMSQLRALERSLTEAIAWKRETATICSSNKQLPGAEVQFIEAVLLQTEQAITNCQRRKQLQETHSAHLRSVYLEARREHETVSILYENALRQFQAEQSRREQSELDEIFLGNLIRTRNASLQPVERDTSVEVHDSNLT
jgi:flagellar export protein FliJ